MGLLLAFLGTLTINLVVAEDVSRSVSTIVPVIVLGALLLKRHQSQCFRPALFAACALNLIFPAGHVVGEGVAPVRNFYAALKQTLPTGYEAAFYYDQYAVLLAQQQRTPEALLALKFAIDADPAYAVPYLDRAEVYCKLGRLNEALANADHAVALNPGLPAAWLSRGTWRVKSHDFAGAWADLDRALRIAPADWPQRADALSMMKKLRTKMGARP